MKKLVTILLSLFLILSSNQLGAKTNFLMQDDNACVTKISVDHGKKEVKLTAHTRGNAPFSFSWSNGESTQSIKVDMPGKYCVKVKDADGCESDACFEVKERDDKKCTSAIQSRKSTSGTKLTVVTRGKAPFKYKWNTGETSQSILAKKPGKYCVKAVDADGCESDACFEVKGRDEKKCTSAIQSRKSTSGTKLTVATRGKAPFKYKWNTGETTQSILAKKTGKYCVKVVDADGCESDACFEVKERDEKKCQTKIRLRRSSKGGVLVARTKGKAPFKYRWSTGESTRIIVVTKSGKYCVKVIDSNGCVSEDCIEVKIRDRGDEKCKTVISEVRTPNKVKGHTLVARTKGKSPFRYSWSNGETTQKIIVTKPGTYCVKVEDADGCISRACYTIKDRKPGDDNCKTVIVTDRTDLQKGTKLTAHSRGKAPFKYRWSNGETTQSIRVMKPGKYCVKVIDADGCVSGDCFEIKGKDEKRCATTIQPERTRDSSIVILTARTKGTAPFKYRWSNGETSQSIKAEVPGKYCVKVVDADGCVSEACFELKKRGRININTNDLSKIGTRGNNIVATGITVKAYPNPIVDQINLDIASDNDQSVNYSILSMSGQLIRTGKLNLTDGINNFNISMNEINSGQYILNLVTEKGVQNIKLEKN